MQTFKKFTNITGIAVLLISFIVYFLTAERTGSLWDCGEFILGAHKLQVVHPPGAGLFVLIGRMFTWIATLFSNDPSNIAFAVNLMSGLCSALAAMFFAWTTMIMGKMALAGREGEINFSQNIALALAGLVGGLSSAFITSVWFSAVEGEVYAMSTFFTALTIWAAVKWYHLPNVNDSDRWLILCLFSAGLSVGVHLLSLLTFPAIGMLYYYKKYENKSVVGLMASIVGGGLVMAFIQKTIIVGLPTLWQKFELLTVNSFGLPFHSGLIPTVLLVSGIIYFFLKLAHKSGNQLLQNLMLTITLLVMAYSTIGVVVIRANADTPVNMNTPTDAMRLVPYLNREQYGERPLLRGPHYLAQPIDVERTPRYGRVGNEYKYIDEKFDYVYKNNDKIFLPRIGHSDKVDLHMMYKEQWTGKGQGKPGQDYNIKYLFKYQLSYMYWRYFYWNFAGRQNSDQGEGPNDLKNGNWITGIKSFDDNKTYNSDLVPDTVSENFSKNTYYMIPFILGLLGLVFHATKSRKDFLATLMLFIVTGIGIILYSNQPPIEPRERDYVLVGSFMTFCIWIGFSVLAIYSLLADKISGNIAGIIGGIIGLASPFILLTQNFDDHDRSKHFASRDYASNFLNSVDKDAIIFTYGDNDTYPLWYAQEVENIRRDVRVVNLSLIQVDWYINKLRNKVNESNPIKLSLSKEMYDGKNINQIYLGKDANRVNLISAWKSAAVGAPQTNGLGQIGTRNFYIPFDKTKVKPGLFGKELENAVDSIEVNVPASVEYITKDDIAILDLIASNIHDRPVYFSVTCKNEKLQGLNDYMQLEGLGLRVVPVKSASDRRFSIYGSGTVNTEKHMQHIMKDWKWGNFDKEKTHVDKSYLAAVQSMKLVMLRGAEHMARTGDSTNAKILCNKFFEAFPHQNFNYDAGIVPFLNIMVAVKDYDNAKKHMNILADETKKFGAFFQSLDKIELSSWQQELSMAASTANDLKRLAKEIKDPAYEKTITDKVGDLDLKLQSLLGPEQMGQ